MENKSEKTFTEEIVENLKREINLLSKVMKTSLSNGEFANYKNLINSYREIIKLIQDLDWRLMYSEYILETGEKQIAVWKQNSDGAIRNHKTWTIDKEYKLYFDVNKGLEDKSWVNVYFNGEHYKYQNLTFSQLASIIKDLIYRKDNVGVYSDCVGMDIGLVDALNDLGIEVNKMKRNSINIK